MRCYCTCPPRYACTHWLRKLAVQESRALRCLLLTHGELPRVAPLDKQATA
jgi:hypothetical protein